MINHGRTLIFNQDGTPRGVPDDPGEELIDPAYVAPTLTGSVRQVHQFLYGQAPDRLMRNYRTAQIMALLHSVPELEEFLTDLDPRITYWPPTNITLFDSTFGETIRQVSGFLPKTLTLAGEPASPGISGQLTREWRIEVQPSNVVLINQHQPSLAQFSESYTVEGGITSLIPLPGSGFSFRFEPADIGTVWYVNSVVRPTKALGEIVRDLKVGGEPLFLDLFKVGTPAGSQEPFKTFRNLWNRQDQLAWELGGLLLALIYRIDEIPVQAVA